MTRQRQRNGVEVIAAPVIIQPTAVYTAPQLRAVLGLRPTTLAREIAEGRLRVSRRAGRYFFVGAWVLAWLESGEVRTGAREG